MRRPIVLRDIMSGQEATTPVDVRLGYELAYARGVSARWQLGCALPVVAAQDGDRLQGIGLDESSLQPVALGDLRLHAKMRLSPSADTPWGYGMAFALTVPTGDEDDFAGEAGAVVAWTMVAGYRGDGWRVAGNLGVRLRTEEVVLLSPARPHGNELVATVAAEGELPARYDMPLGAVLEATRVMGDRGGPSPGELRGGVVVLAAEHTHLKLTLGAGLTPDEVGAPEWRAAAVLEHGEL
jgi:hypothetical protein